jgi:hypothetical protein
MAKRDRTEDLYTGRSGQLVVIAELLSRRCNAAVPEVDVGTDVFAFHDNHDAVARIQVKSAQATPYKKGFGHSAQFGIPLKQLVSADRPVLFYALAVRLAGKYADFLIIRRTILQHFWRGPKRFGTMDKDGNVVLTLQFRDQVLCGEVDLTEFRNAWDSLPPLHTPSEARETPTSDPPGEPPLQ